MVIGELNFLAVEDHEFQLNMLLRMLAGLGATRVVTAADGAEALEIIRSTEAAIDIVISDLEMPGMDGLEFMRHLGEAHSPVAIILASAMESVVLDSVETMTRAYGVRILGVIHKPITREKLSAFIKLYRPGHPETQRVDAGSPSLTIEEIMAGLRQDQFEPFYQPKVD